MSSGSWRAHRRTAMGPNSLDIVPGWTAMEQSPSPPPFLNFGKRMRKKCHWESNPQPGHWDQRPQKTFLIVGKRHPPILVGAPPEIQNSMALGSRSLSFWHQCSARFRAEIASIRGLAPSSGTPMHQLQGTPVIRWSFQAVRLDDFWRIRPLRDRDGLSSRVDRHYQSGQRRGIPSPVPFRCPCAVPLEDHCSRRFRTGTRSCRRSSHSPGPLAASRCMLLGRERRGPEPQLPPPGVTIPIRSERAMALKQVVPRLQSRRGELVLSLKTGIRP
jgi:hypothetical protein